MQVLPIRIFKDNYSYAAFLHKHNSYVLIDPADFDAVYSYISQSEYLRSRHLEAVFSTHKHGDHSGDNHKYRSAYPSIPIICSEIERIPSCNKYLKDSETIQVLSEVQVRSMLTPCHTRGHMLYHFTYNSYSALFTGDTLFIGGCGRFFEGSAAEMLENFLKIQTLPPSTEIFCGHEYTVSNLEWASKVEYSNELIAQKLVWARAQQSHNRPTVPSTIDEELQTNIFMRCQYLSGLLGCADQVETLARLRDLKNQGKTLI